MNADFKSFGSAQIPLTPPKTLSSSISSKNHCHLYQPNLHTKWKWKQSNHFSHFNQPNLHMRKLRRKCSSNYFSRLDQPDFHRTKWKKK
jgi:hypothetical protein